MGNTCLLSLAGTHLPDPLQLRLHRSLPGGDDREGDGGQSHWFGAVWFLVGVERIGHEWSAGLRTAGR